MLCTVLQVYLHRHEQKTRCNNKKTCLDDYHLLRAADDSHDRYLAVCPETFRSRRSRPVPGLGLFARTFGMAGPARHPDFADRHRIHSRRPGRNHHWGVVRRVRRVDHFFDRLFDRIRICLLFDKEVRHAVAVSAVQ